MPCAICHGFVSHGFVRLGFVGHGFVRHGFVRHGIVQRGFVRHGIVHPPEKLHFAKEEKGIETVALAEQREARLSRRRLADRERARACRGSETATQREVRLARRRIADRSRRVSQSQSTEEREARLHQLRVTQQQRIATESTEERGPSSAGAGHSATEDCY